jgi:hypothetical protein
VTCGIGKKSRSRECLTNTGNEIAGDIKDCEGPKVQYEDCEMPSCDSKFYKKKKRKIDINVTHNFSVLRME